MDQFDYDEMARVRTDYNQRGGKKKIQNFNNLKSNISSKAIKEYFLPEEQLLVYTTQIMRG